MSESTSDSCMRAAFQAILRGEYAERDRLLARARLLIDAENRAAKIEEVLAIDFFVNSRGTVYSTQAMAKAAGAIQ